MDRGKMGGERKRPARRGDRGREEMELEGEWDKDGGRNGRQEKGREAWMGEKGMMGGGRKGGRKDKEGGRRDQTAYAQSLQITQMKDGLTDREIAIKQSPLEQSVRWW